MNPAARVSSILPRDMAAVVIPTAAVIPGDSLIYIVLPVSIAEFGIGGSLGLSQAFWIGLALSINRFIRLASNSAAAAVYQRFGLRWPFVAATLVGALTTLSYGFTRGILLLLLARALWGVAYSHLRLASQLTALETGDPASRGKLFGVFNSGQRAGSFAAVTAGAFLADATSRGVTFTILAAVGLLGVIVALKARDIPGGAYIRPPGRKPGPTGRSRIWDAIVAGGPGTDRRTRWKILSISFMRFSTAFAANGLVIATITPYLAEVLEGDASVFGIGVSVLTLAGVLVGVRWFANLSLGVPAGHFSDVFGRRRSVLAGVAVMLVMLALIGLAPNLEAVVIALPVMFISAAFLETALDAAMGESVAGPGRGPAMARYSTWLDLGAATGPILGFLIGDALGFGAGYGIALAVVGSATALYAATSARPARSAGPASAA